MSEEIWKLVPEFDWRYEVSDQGRVRSWVNNGGNKRYLPKIMKPHDDSKGYFYVDLSGQNGERKCPKIHKLVATLFLLKLPHHDQVNHLNGDKSDNRAENLQWCTCSENISHAYRTGITKKKITYDQAKDIRRLYEISGFTQEQIGRAFSLDQSHICNIVNGYAWGDA